MQDENITPMPTGSLDMTPPLKISFVDDCLSGPVAPALSRSYWVVPELPFPRISCQHFADFLAATISDGFLTTYDRQIVYKLQAAKMGGKKALIYSIDRRMKVATLQKDMEDEL